ncbi:unnamed protein product [Brassica rapa]|uniref:Uncharacterized protein n=2 Tax=Brassica TaxID=3705 RepID=A0A8D9CZF6_BRACM|nr:unnamed protein product [Brassica napus]CAG7867850.1 unnamed protein product [Brassica rapa]
MLNPLLSSRFFNLKDQTFRFYFLASWVRERERYQEIYPPIRLEFLLSEIETRDVVMLILCKKLNIFEVLWLVSL